MIARGLRNVQRKLIMMTFNVLSHLYVLIIGVLIGMVVSSQEERK